MPTDTSIPAPVAPTASEVLQKLERIEETSSYGSRPRSPKAIMLDASAIQAKLPDHHVRWVSTTNHDKAVLRKADGYVPVSPEQAGGAPTTVGDLTLMAIPRAKYEAREREIANENRRRGNPKSDFDGSFSRAAEAQARWLRDTHGIKVDPKDLIENSR